MYEEFLKNSTSNRNHHFDQFAFDSIVNSEIKTLFAECGGSAFRNGLYKIHNPESSLSWANLIGQYFAEFKNRIIPFGYDWLGRQYAIDNARKNILLMFDPSTAENSVLNQNLASFHNHDLVFDTESFLSVEFFNEVIEFLNIDGIGHSDCIGHKVPLFLNGSDSLDNFQVISMEVYWEFQSQIYHQIKNLPPGTKINSIKFE